MKSVLRPTIVLLTVCVGSPDMVQAAGRKGYGGALKVPLKHTGGIVDPHRRAIDPSGRLGAELAHCRLLRRDASGRLIGELAEDAWSFRSEGNRGTLELRIRRGATFHDGTRISIKHIESSLKRYKSTGGNMWLRELLREIAIKRSGRRTVLLTVPMQRGGHKGTEERLLELLSRPELAITNVVRGQTSGCGPYMPRGRSNVLRAFKGHPLGRPWIDAVHIKVMETDTEESILYRDRKLDMSLVGSRDHVGGTSQGLKAYATLFLIPSPMLRTRGRELLNFRLAVYHALKKGSLLNNVNHQGAVRVAEGLFPRAFSARRIPSTRGGEWSDDLVIAYPEEHEKLRRPAALIRDILKRSVAGGSVSSPPVAGLTVEKAVNAVRPAWDFALVMFEWAAHTDAQAIMEARFRLKLGNSPTPANFFQGARLKTYGPSLWNKNVPVIPLLHFERNVHHRKALHIEPSVETPDLSNSWLKQP